jgi:hypothetical protein
MVRNSWELSDGLYFVSAGGAESAGRECRGRRAGSRGAASWRRERLFAAACNIAAQAVPAGEAYSAVSNISTWLTLQGIRSNAIRAAGGRSTRNTPFHGDEGFFEGA